MIQLKSIIKWFLFLVISVYILVCGLLFFFQEKLIFIPKKLPVDFAYSFDQIHEEINIKLRDGKSINGLLFTADSSKGLIFYLHGNAGALDTWGQAASTFTNLNYDFFVIDYRGYGKSEGEITGEKQLYDDVQAAYDAMLKHYDENQIIVTGYSIGTGPATYLASINKPAGLFLQAPYFNLTEIALSQYPFIPRFLLKYKFETAEMLPKVHSPVVIFHGDQDQLITVDHAYKLQKLFKPSDKLIIIEGLGHNGMNNDESFKMELAAVLASF